MSTQPNLQLKNIEYQRQGKMILDQLNLELAPQKIYTVIGPSGAGKTTLLKILGGLVIPTAGELYLGGESYTPKKQQIALVPQDYGLLPWQTARKAVTDAVKISRGQKQLTGEDKKRIQQLFLDMSLSEEMDRYPGQLSGGQKQRVAITRGFAAASELLLMDEPFSALDALTREQAQSLFLKNWLKQPTRTLFITHDVNEALLLGHQIIVMAKDPGRIIEIFPSPFQDKNQDISRNNQELFDTASYLRGLLG